MQVDAAAGRRPRARVIVAVVSLIAFAAATVGLGVGGLDGLRSGSWRDLALPWSDGTKDTDSDGLTDAVERRGWRTADDGVYVTDPRSKDSDSDGLTDGQEAGPLLTAQQSARLYTGLSNPVERDTDGDGVGDGDEYFLDMDPRRQDTDGDELLDDAELDFGSDPTRGNVDEDSYSDKEAFERRSDPLAYDLTRREAIGAFLGGASAGDSEGLARRFGVGQAQWQSSEYLLGQIAGGLIGIGDVRDVAAQVGSGDLVGATVAAVGLAPLAGDTVKISATMATFAKRGERAERSADSLIERLPWSTSTKERVRRTLFGSAVRLPGVLRGGPKDYSVYKGLGYVGITNDFLRRAKKHAAAGRSFRPEVIPGATGLSRGEARAIEEACIVEIGLKAGGGNLENQVHSIDPRAPYYSDAVTWGRERLKVGGGTCA